LGTTGIKKVSSTVIDLGTASIKKVGTKVKIIGKK
jgi:hypothetical protein